MGSQMQSHLPSYGPIICPGSLTLEESCIAKPSSFLWSHHLSRVTDPGGVLYVPPHFFGPGCFADDFQKSDPLLSGSKIAHVENNSSPHHTQILKHAMVHPSARRTKGEECYCSARLGPPIIIILIGIGVISRRYSLQPLKSVIHLSFSLFSFTIVFFINDRGISTVV
jgi:hypothetical protein